MHLSVGKKKSSVAATVSIKKGHPNIKTHRKWQPSNPKLSPYFFWFLLSFLFPSEGYLRAVGRVVVCLRAELLLPELSFPHLWVNSSRYLKAAGATVLHCYCQNGGNQDFFETRKFFVLPPHNSLSPSAFPIWSQSLPADLCKVKCLPETHLPAHSPLLHSQPFCLPITPLENLPKKKKPNK